MHTTKYENRTTAHFDRANSPRALHGPSWHIRNIFSTHSPQLHSNIVGPLAHLCLLTCPLAQPCTHPLGYLGWEQDLGTHLGSLEDCGLEAKTSGSSRSCNCLLAVIVPPWPSLEKKDVDLTLTHVAYMIRISRYHTYTCNSYDATFLRTWIVRHS